MDAFGHFVVLTCTNYPSVGTLSTHTHLQKSSKTIANVTIPSERASHRSNISMAGLWYRNFHGYLGTNEQNEAPPSTVYILYMDLVSEHRVSQRLMV